MNLSLKDRMVQAGYRGGENANKPSQDFSTKRAPFAPTLESQRQPTQNTGATQTVLTDRSSQAPSDKAMSLREYMAVRKSRIQPQRESSSSVVSGMTMVTTTEIASLLSELKLAKDEIAELRAESKRSRIAQEETLAMVKQLLKSQREKKPQTGDAAGSCNNCHIRN